MARNLDIPPPIKDGNKVEYILESAKLREAEAWVAKHSKTSFETEENIDQYLQELSKISEAENWVEKHSVEKKSSINENKIMQNHQITKKESVLLRFFEAIIVIFGQIIFERILPPILVVMVIGFFLYGDFLAAFRFV